MMDIRLIESVTIQDTKYYSYGSNFIYHAVQHPDINLISRGTEIDMNIVFSPVPNHQTSLARNVGI